MLRKYRFEILALVSILVFFAFFLWMGRGEFAGTDTLASAQISGTTGIPEEQFQPLVWQWIPPSGEIESALFALQAAVGGILVGWFFGYWRGQKEREKERG